MCGKRADASYLSLIPLHWAIVLLLLRLECLTRLGSDRVASGAMKQLHRMIDEIRKWMPFTPSSKEGPQKLDRMHSMWCLAMSYKPCAPGGLLGHHLRLQ